MPLIGTYPPRFASPSSTTTVSYVHRHSDRTARDPEPLDATTVKPEYIAPVAVAMMKNNVDVVGNK